jgi:hypothetical protein
LWRVCGAITPFNDASGCWILAMSELVSVQVPVSRRILLLFCKGWGGGEGTLLGNAPCSGGGVYSTVNLIFGFWLRISKNTAQQSCFFSHCSSAIVPLFLEEQVATFRRSWSAKDRLGSLFRMSSRIAWDWLTYESRSTYPCQSQQGSTAFKRSIV